MTGKPTEPKPKRPRRKRFRVDPVTTMFLAGASIELDTSPMLPSNADFLAELAGDPMGLASAGAEANPLNTPQRLASQDHQQALRARYRQACAAEAAERARLIAAGVPEVDLWRAMAGSRLRVDFSAFADLRCGATSKRTGQPCQRTDLYACGRCRFHGGLSTGPKTADGKARSAANGKAAPTPATGPTGVSAAYKKGEPKP